jgi:ParB family transcriptional regulator, chromosome partitioning protein
MIAQLPVEVIECFRSPLEIQSKHAEQVVAAMEIDRKSVMDRAERIRLDSKRSGASQVVAQLTGRTANGAIKADMCVGDVCIGTSTLDSRGRAVITINARQASNFSMDAILHALRATLSDMAIDRAQA